MNDDTTPSEPLDRDLAALLLGEVPAPRDDYWQRIDAALSPVENDITPAATVEPIARRRMSMWPLVAAAAVLIVGFFVIGNREGFNNNELVVGDTANQPGVVPGLGPRQNLDHWNAVYAVWDCTLNDGDGDWIPSFQSARDDWGIHSHGDGLISIHPFVAESAEENATLALFVESMGVELTDTSITLDDGRVLSESGAQTCDGQTPVVHLRRWPSAPDLEADPALTPTVVTQNISGERFLNDLEVWTIAFAPLDADVPRPPRDRFDELAAWWVGVPVDGAGVTVLRPTSVGGPDIEDSTGAVDATVPVPVGPPRFDRYVSLRPGLSPGEAEPALMETIDQLPEAANMSSDRLVQGTTRSFVATASRARQVLGLAIFSMRDPGQPDREHTCHVLSDAVTAKIWSAGCDFADEQDFPEPVRWQAQAGDTWTLAVWNLPDDAAWLEITTDDGTTIGAAVVDGVALAAWRTDRGEAAAVTALDADLNMVWPTEN